MALPNINIAKVAELVPSATDIEEIGRGGQKIVFKAKLDGKDYALKFAYLGRDIDDEGSELADVRARAHREVEIMRDCDSPYVVKLGPLGIDIGVCDGQRLLYFSEELITGLPLNEILRNGPIDIDSTITLGLQIADAISNLWSLGKVHRDIKPGNIMRRATGDFVLLDAGLAFDIAGESLSQGAFVGTFAYCSPEQFDYSSRRILDFRSDQFSLGIVMYEACTGVHPFMRPGMSISRIYSGITSHHPAVPSSIRADIPPELDTVILRLLGKSSHLRYRKMEQLVASLVALKGE